MTRLLQRRKVLKGGLAGIAAYTFAPALRAADAVAATALTENISVLNVAGVNVVVAVTDAAVVLVDTGPKDATPALVGQLQSMSTRTDYKLFYTHWHSDQIGGHAVFSRLNAPAIMHKKTRERFSTNPSATWYLPAEELYRYPVTVPARPTEPVYQRGYFLAGSETVDYGDLPQGHTDGDLYVYFRNANVLAAGDMVSPERDPELDWYAGGWLGGRVEALDVLLALSNDTTRIVPAYGPVISKAQMQVERDMMAFLYARLVEQMGMGFDEKDSFDSGIMNGLMRRFDDPQKFLHDAYRGLGGADKRPDPAPPPSNVA